MSKANKPAKVLRTALKRIQKGWTQGQWSDHQKKTGVTTVCIEGAIYGFKNHSENEACQLAKDIVLEVIKDKYPDEDYTSIPSFNDADGRTLQEVEEVVKTALIRAETGGLLRDEEVESFL